MTSDEIEKMRKEQEQYNTYGFGRWSWFAMIEKLANHDITKFNEVGKQNFISCLNLLSYWKEKDAEQRRIEQAQKQHI